MKNTPWSSPRLQAALLFLGTLVLYLPAVFFQFIYYDDNDYVFENAPIVSGLSPVFFKWFLTAVVSANWHPLTLLSHAADCQLFGLWPGGHHLTSILFHAANAVLVFWVFRQASVSPGKAFLIAAVFAWHPVKAESVAWIAERKDVLSTFFVLLSMLMYTKLNNSRLPANASSSTGRMHLSVYLFFVLSLLAKPMYVTLPLLLLIWDFWPLARQDKKLPALLTEKIPFCMVSAVSCLITLAAQHAGKAIDPLKGGGNLFARAADIGWSYADYITLFFWPSKLAIVYPYFSKPAAGGILACLALAAAALFLFFKRKIYPAVWGGWLWFLVTLIPVIGIVSIGLHWIACRYLYTASIGLTVMAVYLSDSFLSRLKVTPSWKAGLSALILVSVFAATAQHLPVWRNSYTLFEHAVKVVPRNFVAHMNLRAAYGRDGLDEKAAEHFIEALKIFPKVTNRFPPSWPDFYYMGAVEWRKGRIPQAASFWKASVQLLEARENAAEIKRSDSRWTIMSGCLAAAANGTARACRLPESV